MERQIETQVTKVKTTAAVNTQQPQKVYQTKKVIFRTYQIIWYILGVIEVLLLFRLILKMLGANASSGFTNLVYSLSDPLALPFSGVFGITVAEGSVFEWSTIVAGIVYAIVAYGIVELFQIVKPTTPQEVEQTVDNQ